MNEMDRLLSGGDRARTLRDDERSRILARIENAITEHSANPIHFYGLSEDDRLQTTPPPAWFGKNTTPERQRWFLVAAVIALIAGFVGFAAHPRSSRESVSLDATELAENATPPPVAAICANEVTDVATALEAWGGVGAWALTTQDPVPDLPGAIFAALGALSPLDASLAQVGADLRDELDKPANAAFDRALRQQVVVGTLQALANSIDQLDPTGQWCDLTRFRTAIELDIES